MFQHSIEKDNAKVICVNKTQMKVFCNVSFPFPHHFTTTTNLPSTKSQEGFDHSLGQSKLVIFANPVNFVFVWVPVTRDKVVKVQEPLPNRLIKQQQEVDS